MTSVYEAVQAACLAFDETEEKISHGFPIFTVRGKQFATYSLNHHGDGKIALLLNASVESQTMLIESAPKIFFKPPYIGHKGWIGVELNKGLKWPRVLQLTFEAFVRTAPASLAKKASAPDVPAPTQELTPEDIDPLKSTANQKLVKQIENICLTFPEVESDRQFGNPSFRAGKKNFCVVAHGERGPYLQFWVGRDAQGGFTDDKYWIPAYVGHNGWLNLSLLSKPNWQEIKGLLETSYRHFALKRMLKALDES